VSPPGRDLGQRLEDEPAAVEPAVGKRQLRRHDRLAPDVEEIDVDRPGSVSKRAPAAAPPFDPLDGRQQFPRREPRSDLHDGVEEGPLAFIPFGGGLVDG
jgi:hypothetical protein